MEITSFQLFNIMKYFRCQLKICEGINFANIFLGDIQANKFERQDLISFLLGFHFIDSERCLGGKPLSLVLQTVVIFSETKSRTKSEYSIEYFKPKPYS